MKRVKKEYRFIKDPRIYAIYIRSKNLLIITTNEAGKRGVIFLK